MSAGDLSEQDCSVTVMSTLDGKQFKMVMKGDVGLLTVNKIKRYLQHATGLDPKEQRLTYEQRLLLDHERGSDFGLHDGAIIVLGLLNTAATHHQHHASSVSKSGGEPQQPASVGSQRDAAHTPSAHAASFEARDASPTTRGSVGRLHLNSTVLQDTEWHLKELQRVREEERHRFELEKRRREDEEHHREIDRTRVTERNRLLEEDFRSMERKYKLECEKLRIQLSKEERLTQELREKIQIMEEDRICENERMKEERRRHEADQSRKDKERLVADEEMEQLVIRLHREIDSLRIDNLEMERRLRRDVSSGAPPHKSSPQRSSPSPSAVRPRGPSCSPAEVLAGSLEKLSRELGVSALQLDANHTCIVSLESVNLILTFDPNTQRLFMYTTLLNHLPEDLAVRMQLYEELLQGALLGRDIAGGCVGISKTTNRLILLSTSFDLEHVDESALQAAARPFIAATKRWVAHARSICAGEVPRAPSMNHRPSPDAKHHRSTFS